MNRVVFSTTPDRRFAWLSPLTAMAWRFATGFRPMCMTVGTLPEDIEARLREVGCDVVSVKPGRTRADGVAQLCRLFGYVVTDPGDYIMLADCDMWPLTNEGFEPTGAALDILTPGPWPLVPVCYVGATGTIWREIMGAWPTIEAGLENLSMDSQFGTGFSCTEKLLTSRIRRWAGIWDAAEPLFSALVKHANVSVTQRQGGECPDDRIWPANWAGEWKPGLVDVHLCARTFPHDWPQMRKCLVYAGWPPMLLDWADEYAREVPCE